MSFDEDATQQIVFDDEFVSMSTATSGGGSHETSGVSGESSQQQQQQHHHHHHHHHNHHHQPRDDFSTSRYERECVLGRGGFGVVYLAHSKVDPTKKVAIKVASDSANRELRRECLLLAQLPPDRNVVQVLDVELSDDRKRVALVMEFCSRGALSDQLVPSSSPSSLFTESTLACVAAQLLAGIRFIHMAGIIHRDIKPQNILVDDAGTLKVADFGLVNALTSVGVQGTLAFLSPESLDGDGGQASDIWALGCTLSMLALNKSPWSNVRQAAGPSMASQFFEMKKMFRVLTREQLLAKISHELLPSQDAGWSDTARDFIMKLLEPDPSLRPTAAEMLEHEWLSQHEEAREQLEIVRKSELERVEKCRSEAERSPTPVSLIALARLLPAKSEVELAVRSSSSSSTAATAATSETTAETAQVKSRKFTRCELLLRACEMDPQNDLLWFICGSDPESNSAWHPSARIPLAQFALNKCVELVPDDAFYWLRLGMCARYPITIDGERVNNRIAFIRALELDPNLPVAWHALGTKLQKFNPNKRVTIKGASFSFRECLARAAQLIHISDTNGNSSDNNNSNTVATADHTPAAAAAAATSSNTVSPMMRQFTDTTATGMIMPASSANSSSGAGGGGSSGAVSSSMMTSRVLDPSILGDIRKTPTAMPLAATLTTSGSISDEQKLQLELVTAVVTKARPRDFWSNLGRALPLRTRAIAWEKQQQEQNAAEAAERAAKAIEFAKRGKKLPPPQQRKREERLDGWSRTLCLIKAVESDDSDPILLFDLAISLAHDDMCLTDEERNNPNRQFHLYTVQRVLSRAVLQARLSLLPHWNLMAWIFAARLMRRFAVDRIELLPTEQQQQQQPQLFVTPIECIRLAIDASRQQPFAPENIALLKREMSLLQQSQPQSTAEEAANTAEQDSNNNSSDYSFVARYLSHASSNSQLPSELQLRPDPFLNSEVGVEMSFLHAGDTEGYLRVAGVDTWNGGAINATSWQYTIIQRFLLRPFVDEQQPQQQQQQNRFFIVPVVALSKNCCVTCGETFESMFVRPCFKEEERSWLLPRQVFRVVVMNYTKTKFGHDAATVLLLTDDLERVVWVLNASTDKNATVTVAPACVCPSTLIRVVFNPLDPRSDPRDNTACPNKMRNQQKSDADADADAGGNNDDDE